MLLCLQAAAHILCCCDTQPQVHKRGVTSGPATACQEEHDVPQSLQVFTHHTPHSLAPDPCIAFALAVEAWSVV